ncbi:MAG: response regulator transcription factor [Muribaculaceae bacterium]|nr:response regulator transcription factor [Muribaculaceae bacterium]
MLKAIAIDDEPIALLIIREFCQRVGDIDLVTFSSAQEGLAAVTDQCPNILFLDIMLDQDNGVELAHDLPPGVHLIFTTAYTEYAQKGFELDAVDYLHKPFSYERFVQAIDKVRRRLNTMPQSISIKSDYKNVIIDTDEILYIEAMDNYVCYHMADGRKLMTQATLTSQLSLLPDSMFVRIHKSFVVSRRYVEKFNRHQVFLRGVKLPLPVGRTFSDAIQRL